MSNMSFVKLSIKYFCVIVLAFAVFAEAADLVSSKSDFENVIGLLLFLGLFIGTVLIFKRDVIKTVNQIKTKEKNKNNE